jgi:lipoprotein NlpD
VPPSKSIALTSKKSPSASKLTGGRQLNWRKPSEGPVIRGFVDGDLTRKGVQFGGKEGDSVLAAESGKVVYSGTGLIGYGRLIIIKHDDNYLSAYGNNRSILVKEGQSVSAGERVAEMGRSDQGKAYLYFEIRQQGKPIDPMGLLPR